MSVGTGLKLNGPAKEGGVSDMLKQLAGEERKVVEVALGEPTGSWGWVKIGE